MHGELMPGEHLTLRGLAEEYGLSMTPVREAVRRLSTEGALALTATGRITTPELDAARIEELAVLRSLIEPELAARALPRAHFALIDRMNAINSSIAEAAVKGDACRYIRHNLEFHRALYLRAQAPAMLAVIETVWLQLGPTMRRLYEEQSRQVPPRAHRVMLAALKAGDEPALRLAVKTDVTRGLRHLLGQEGAG